MIAVGGALGAAARYGIADTFAVARATFPTTTLTINLAGALALGVLLESLVRWRGRDGAVEADQHRGDWLRIFVGVGLIGSFTTFSTFSLEIAGLIRDDRPLLAAAYATTSVVGGIVACLAGLAVAGWRRTPVPEEGES